MHATALPGFWLHAQHASLEHYSMFKVIMVTPCNYSACCHEVDIALDAFADDLLCLQAFRGTA